MNLPTTITDGSVVLRPVREDDRAVVLSAMSDPLVTRWLNMPRSPGDADFDSLVRVARSGPERPGSGSTTPSARRTIRPGSVR